MNFGPPSICIIKVEQNIKQNKLFSILLWLINVMNLWIICEINSNNGKTQVLSLKIFTSERYWNNQY